MRLKPSPDFSVTCIGILTSPRAFSLWPSAQNQAAADGAAAESERPYVTGPGDASRVMVRMRGLEPPRVTPLEPKSSASTSSATSAGKQGGRYDGERRGGQGRAVGAGLPLAGSRLRHGDELRAVFEVHAVEIGPATAPDEAVALERLHDLDRDAVAIAA